MIETAHRDDLSRVADQLQQAVNQFVGAHFAEFHPTETWTPPMNAYRLDDRIEVCVDLAGVDKQSIDVRVEPEPGRLRLRGVRATPEPHRGEGEAIQILTMEIDYGPFERTFALPRAVDPGRITAEQTNGLLWIRLPFRTLG